MKCITIVQLVHWLNYYPILVRFYSATNTAYHSQDGDEKKTDESAKYADHNSSKYIGLSVVVTASNINKRVYFSNSSIFFKRFVQKFIS